MKKSVLIDIRVIADIDQAINYRGTMESYANQAECLSKEFNDFVRDHRSMDWVSLSVERIYEEQCEHCHREWELDDAGTPACCEKAVEEFYAR